MSSQERVTAGAQYMSHPAYRAAVPRRRRWPLFLPFAIVVLLAVAWTGLWFSAAARAETEIAAWRARIPGWALPGLRIAIHRRLSVPHRGALRRRHVRPQGCALAAPAAAVGPGRGAGL